MNQKEKPDHRDLHGEIITIGNELTAGRTMDLNAWYAAGRLTASGLTVRRITTVGDDPERASKSLIDALEDAHFVIVTGGLGSTDDDMTCEIAANALKRPLSLDRKMFHRIKTFVESRGIELTPSMEKMAWMPEGSHILHPDGDFCGFSLREKEVRIYFLPGVPDQMRFLMDRFVLPEILSRYRTLPVMRQRILKLYGLNEPRIADLMKGFQESHRALDLGFYPNFPENHITVSLRGPDEDFVTKELDLIEADLRRILGPHVFASGNQTMESVTGEALRTRGMTVAVAESCTGGLIGDMLTNVPGSSAYFQGGMLVYSNEAKVDLLGVSPGTLERVGAVSDATAREMARGVKERLKTDLGMAVTGIAGPEGGSRAKPVGTVHLSLAAPGETFAARYRFWGTRLQIKKNTAMMALDWVRRYLDGHPFLPGM